MAISISDSVPSSLSVIRSQLKLGKMDYSRHVRAIMAYMDTWKPRARSGRMKLAHSFIAVRVAKRRQDRNVVSVQRSVRIWMILVAGGS